MDNFYFLCMCITCNEQTFNCSDQVQFILKEATQVRSLFHIRMPLILTLKPKPINLNIKENNHVYQDLQKSL